MSKENDKRGGLYILILISSPTMIDKPIYTVVLNTKIN
jgi:hypothetical protein